MNNYRIPSFSEEKSLGAQGYRFVAGVDEVGRGPLAGPVVAAAVILPLNLKVRWLREVRDSKQLSSAKREFLYPLILEVAVSVAVGQAGHDVIDGRGIIVATRMAMKLAIDGLATSPDYLLIDYLSLPEVPLPQKGIVYGDGMCLSIACASIVAKVTRDRMMVEFDKIYPGYRLAQHKGYGTGKHLECLNRLGPCPIHRRTFRPLKDRVY
ncbi:ribonuclease HII [Chloroflexota bacterium]